MRAEDVHRKQQEWLDREGDCTCLVHHPLDPRLRAELEEVVRSGKGALVPIAVEGLSPCPTRAKKRKK